MPSTGLLDPSPTTTFVGTRPPVIEIPPSLTPSSDEEVDYSRDDFDFNGEPAPPSTNKFSHLTIEEMEVTSLIETVLPPTEVAFFKR